MVYRFTPEEILIGTAPVWDEKASRWAYEFLTLHEDGGENGPVPMREVGNLVTVAPPGGGKTRQIEAQLLNWGQSIVVIDLKGGLYRTTAAYRAQLGPVIVLDPRDGRGSRYNPVAVIRVKARRTLAQEIVSRGRDDADPFWTSVAAQFWECCWYAADEVNRPHIPYAVEIINLGLLGALRYLMAYHGENRHVTRILSNFMVSSITPELLQRITEQGASKLVESKWASVVESAAPFDMGMLNIFNGHDIDPAQMFKKPTTLYIMADETDAEGFAMFARLVMKTLGDALIMAGDKLGFDERLPVLFMFDEFGAIRVNNARQWMNTMRSRGVILWLFAQSLAQLPSETRGNYDANRENSIHHWIVFSSVVGDNEAGTWISQMSGTTTVAVQGGESVSQNLTAPDGGLSRSTSISYRERHNVEAEDVDSWAMNQAAVSMRKNGKPRRFYGPVTIANADDLGLRSNAGSLAQPALLSDYEPPVFAEPEPHPVQDEDNGRGRDRTRGRRYRQDGDDEAGSLFD